MGLFWMLLTLAVPGNLPGAEPPPDYRFKPETLATGLVQPMELEIAPDGRIFFNELNGKLRLWKAGAGLVEVGKLTVFAAQENGFLGFALDPQFARNGWIYLLFAHRSDRPAPESFCDPRRRP